MTDGQLRLSIVFGVSILVMLVLGLSHMDTAPEPRVTMSSGTQYTESAYRDRVDGYIVEMGYYVVCIDHTIGHLGNIELNLTEYFPDPDDRDNARRIITIYRQACAAWKATHDVNG